MTSPAPYSPSAITPSNGSILQGMIFHHDRQPFLFWVQRWAFRHCPAFQDVIEFQPKIVMKTGSLVLLHHKDERVLRSLHLPFWFWFFRHILPLVKCIGVHMFHLAPLVGN